MAQILSTSDNGDGTVTVTVATVTHGQAVVVVRKDALHDPATEALYEHVADMGTNAYTVVRRSRRDRKRYGDDRPVSNG